jgi:hypothetical protein
MLSSFGLLFVRVLFAPFIQTLFGAERVPVLALPVAVVSKLLAALVALRERAYPATAAAMLQSVTAPIMGAG